MPQNDQVAQVILNDLIQKQLRGEQAQQGLPGQLGNPQINQILQQALDNAGRREQEVSRAGRASSNVLKNLLGGTAGIPGDAAFGVAELLRRSTPPFPGKQDPTMAQQTGTTDSIVNALGGDPRSLGGLAAQMVAPGPQEAVAGVKAVIGGSKALATHLLPALAGIPAFHGSPFKFSKFKADFNIRSNSDGSVVIDAFHGTFADDLPSTKNPKFGGIHVGTEKAAIQRLDAIRPSQHGGMPGGENIIPVRVTLKKPFGSEAQPVTENELFPILNLKNWEGTGDAGQKIFSIDRLKEQGFDGIIYRNSIEDRNSISAMAFNRASITKRGKEVAKAGNKISDLGGTLIEGPVKPSGFQLWPRLQDGSKPKSLFRYMSQAEFDAGMKAGKFSPRKGNVFHAAGKPDARFRAKDQDVLVEIEYRDADDWNAKLGGGDSIEAITRESIPASIVHRIGGENVLGGRVNVSEADVLVKRGNNPTGVYDIVIDGNVVAEFSFTRWHTAGKPQSAGKLIIGDEVIDIGGFSYFTDAKRGVKQIISDRTKLNGNR